MSRFTTTASTRLVAAVTALLLAATAPALSAGSDDPAAPTLPPDTVGVGAETSGPAGASEASAELCLPGQDGVTYGTAGNDVLRGTPRADVLCGLGGEDTLKGAEGDDVLVGGAGRDSLLGQEGDDTLMGGDGNDTLEGGNGGDALLGEVDDDILEGGRVRDQLDGGDGDDSLRGGDGDDRGFGGDGQDTLLGQDGDDTLFGDDGTDKADGYDGQDLCDAEAVAKCEQDEAGLSPYAEPLPVDLGEAGPRTITVDNVFPGLEVHLETNGGIWPWDVHVSPARDYMAGPLADRMPGGAWDITVPEHAPAFESGTLTLPYDPAKLDGFPEQELRVFWFDPETQLWTPASKNQVVDAEANTVTTPVSHFSVYAVLSMSSDDWNDFFAETPIRCISGTDPRTQVDAALLMDSSGSMAWEDPQGLRVDGAKEFVAGMRDRDRASVVSFEGSAVTRIGLTRLDTQANRDAVNHALESTRYAGGGTNIGAAVARATSILSAGTDPAIRIAILMTDGQSGYDPGLTAEAARAGIEIHTVGLGPGVNSALLQQIADGTGGTYQHLANPQQLPDLYATLVGDLIDDGTDTDSDTLTDCVERNGMFVPITISFPLFGDYDYAHFVTSNPEQAFTDGDGLRDDQEVVEQSLLADPVLAEEYHTLVEQGLTTYYTMIADPNLEDSDGDGIRDDHELEAGTDPLVRNDQRLGIDGLDLPASTLFQPVNYPHPALPMSLEVHSINGQDTVVEQRWNDDPVVFGVRGGCVENCEALEELAAERPDDNGWGVCIGGFGDCVTDATQVEDIIEEARIAQGIFNDEENGWVRGEYVFEQALLVCSIWGSPQDCADVANSRYPDGFRDMLPEDALAAATVIVIDLPGPGIGINEQWKRRIGRAIGGTAVIGGTALAVSELIDALEESTESCYRNTSLDHTSTAAPYRHPCDVAPVFSPGLGAQEAAEHDLDAIVARPDWSRLTYRSRTEQAALGVSRTWYNSSSPCDPAGRAAAAAQRPGVSLDCDEYPFYTSTAGGPGASLRMLFASHNRSEGAHLGLFQAGCPTVGAATVANRQPYLVAPVPTAPTVWHCGGRF